MSKKPSKKYSLEKLPKMSGIRLETVILQPFRDFRDFEGFHPHLVPAPNPAQCATEKNSRCPGFFMSPTGGRTTNGTVSRRKMQFDRKSTLDWSSKATVSRNSRSDFGVANERF